MASGTGCELLSLALLVPRNGDVQLVCAAVLPRPPQHACMARSGGAPFPTVTLLFLCLKVQDFGCHLLEASSYAQALLLISAGLYCHQQHPPSLCILFCFTFVKPSGADTPGLPRCATTPKQHLPENAQPSPTLCHLWPPSSQGQLEVLSSSKKAYLFPPGYLLLWSHSGNSGILPSKYRVRGIQLSNFFQSVVGSQFRSTVHVGPCLSACQLQGAGACRFMCDLGRPCEVLSAVTPRLLLMEKQHGTLTEAKKGDLHLKRL